MPSEVRFLQGNEACAEGAIAAGVRFYAGYPITPSSEIAEEMAAKLPKVGGVFIQMEDEIGSIAACIGASLAGVKAMTATSGPGFSLMQENIGYACMAEVPCVVVNVMRGGPSTGLPTLPAQGDVMQARWGTHGDHPAIAVCPWSVEEMFTLTIRAVNLSEKYRTPVVLLSDEVVAHMREKVRIPTPEEIEIWERPRPTCPPEQYRPYEPDPATDVPPMADFGDGYRYNVTGLVHDETGFATISPAKTSALVERLVRKVEKARCDIVQVDTRHMEKARLAVFAYGCAARAALRAVRDARAMGVPVGLFRPITLWPFPEAEVRALASDVDAIIVAEMNLGQMVMEVERVVAGRCAVVSVAECTGELVKPQHILQSILQGTGSRPVTFVRKAS